MHYLKDLFIKGRFHIYIACGMLFQAERTYFLENTSTYRKIREEVQQQLKFIEPENDHSSVKLQTMSETDLNKLKTITKKKIVEIQNLSRQSGSTLPYTSSILGLGAISYFLHPTICAVFVPTYLTVLITDFVKSVYVIKSGKDPLWQWKMKDLGYLMTTTFGFITIALLTRAGIAKLKERATKQIILRNSAEKKE